ncbi:PTS system, sucrose-specific IIC component [Streptomyces sp. SolWspMP-sol7th]|nr:PTS system, sucrose-specific IIC component [Streptomyces sp. SolWspMP-sol7th]
MAGNEHVATAAAILPLVGGAANVTSVTHCMTRLRLGLADRSRVDDAALRALPAVLGVVEDGDSYQIVLGPGKVARVTPEFARLVDESADTAPVADAVTGAATGVARSDNGAASTADALASRGAEIRAERRSRNRTPSNSSSAASPTSSCPSSPR